MSAGHDAALATIQSMAYALTSWRHWSWRSNVDDRDLLEQIGGLPAPTSRLGALMVRVIGCSSGEGYSSLSTDISGYDAWIHSMPANAYARLYADTAAGAPFVLSIARAILAQAPNLKATVRARQPRHD